MLIRIAYGIVRQIYRTIGMRTQGARAIVFDPDGAVLLIRARYGARDRWQFPGGGIHRGEDPRDAAIRETREEAGITIDDVQPVGVFARADGRWRDTVHVFRARGAGSPRPDGREIAEARWCALATLPPITRATRRRLDEIAGRRTADGAW